jgi:hypothetical protein
MTIYKIIKNSQGLDICILRNGKDSIPFDPANTDYQEYLKWVEAGNTPEAADE